MWDQLDVLDLIWYALSIGLYAYFSSMLMIIARKTGTRGAWQAWLPIVNFFLICRIARKEWFWALLLMVPCVNIVAVIVLAMAVAQARGKSPALGLLAIVPIANLLLPAILAVGPGVAGAASAARTSSGVASSNDFHLNVAGRMIRLARGVKLRYADVPELRGQAGSAKLAKVSSNPRDPAVLGLENCSTSSWDVVLPDGKSRQVNPGQSVRLAEGTRIDIDRLSCYIAVPPPAFAAPRTKAAAPSGGSRRLLVAGGAGLVMAGVLCLMAFGVYYTLFRKSDERLLADLQSSDGKSRLSAAKSLGSRRSAAAVPELVSKTADPEYAVGEASVAALAKIGPPAVPSLIDSLESEDFATAAQANEALGRMGTAAIPELVKLLRSKDAKRQEAASYALSTLGPNTVAPLMKLIDDSDVEVQRAGLRALGDLQTDFSKAIPKLRKALNSSDETVRVEAAYALSRLGPDAQPALPDLIKLLDDAAASVRGAAAIAIGEMGPAANSAVQPLESKRADKDPVVRDQIELAILQIKGAPSGAQP